MMRKIERKREDKTDGKEEDTKEKKGLKRNGKKVENYIKKIGRSGVLRIGRRMNRGDEQQKSLS